MSLNTGNAILSNAITVDGSYNVGIGTTPSYKLDVSGTGRFSGDVSIVEAGNALLRVQASTTTTPIADIELMRGTNTTWGADAYTDYRIRNSVGELLIQSGESGVTSTRLTISSTGAATFSSSVTATSGTFYLGDGINGTYFLGGSGNTARQLKFSTSTTTNVGDTHTIDAQSGTGVLQFSVTSSPKMTILSSGNVGIGTTSPSTILETIGQITVNGAASGAATGTLQIKGAKSDGNGLNFTFNNSTNLADITNYYSGALSFGTSNTERMRITSGGNVGIGTSSPKYNAYGSGSTTLTIQAQSGDNIGILELGGTRDIGGNQNGMIMFYNRFGTSYETARIVGANTASSNAAGELQFLTAASAGSVTERMRITSGGYVRASNYANGSYPGSAYSHDFSSNNGFYDTLTVTNANSTYTGTIITMNMSAKTGSTDSYFLYGIANGLSKMYVYTNGAFYGNGTYGTVSDIKLKENIIDATPKLDDILKLKVRNFNFKDNPKEKHLGFIAQEFEEVFPNLIDNNEDFEEVEIEDKDGNKLKDKKYLGTYTKTIKTSILIPALVKAIQELNQTIQNQQQQINQLINK